MAELLVSKATMDGENLKSLTVTVLGVGERVMDRDAVVSNLKDGHSFIPVVDGKRLPALQLVEREGGFVVRSDHAVEGPDQLPF